jgi:two-component system, OmpR family, KDP operon response regulator KdpE
MEPHKLLVVARTQSLAKRLAEDLEAEHHLLRWVSSTSTALQLDMEPDLILLELPVSGGTRNVFRLKRSFDAPLLVVCHDGQAAPEGADAALAHPWLAPDLVGLVASTLLAHSPHLVRAGEMLLDTRTRRLQMPGSFCQLRPLACRILAQLMANAGRVMSRDELARRVWEMEDGDVTRALDVHIAYLRRLIEPDPGQPQLIVTEWGIGYKLVLPRD